MVLDDCWLDQAWSFIQPRLPPPPARVLDLGCGPRGGLVPALVAAGFDAVGVDPVAPEANGDETHETRYHPVEFERFHVERRVDAIVASRSLHHVGDLDLVADRMAQAIVRQGVVLVLEWDWERFDEATARWCFDRLPPPGPDPDADDPARWLRTHHERWIESGRPWDDYFPSWVAEHGFHSADAIRSALGLRFEQTGSARGPYFSCCLADTSEADEQAAIDAGEIRATGLQYTAAAVDTE